MEEVAPVVEVAPQPVVEEKVEEVAPVVEVVPQPVVEEKVEEVVPVVEVAPQPVVEEKVEETPISILEEDNKISPAINFSVPRPIKESASSFTAPVFVPTTPVIEKGNKIVAQKTGITKLIINYKLQNPSVNNTENVKVIPLNTNQPIDNKRGRYRVILDAYNNEKPYKYQLLTKNGQILFESDGYKIKPRAKQIETFKKAIMTGTFVYEQEQNGSFRYKLVSANGKICNIKDMYQTLEDAEKSALATKKYGLAANYIEDISEA